MSISHMIFSGVFERYPKLQVGSVEMELSWVPHFLDRVDYNYTQRPPTGDWHWFKDDMLPSDYCRRNVFLVFQEAALGIQWRDLIGVDSLMWGSDYPQVDIPQEPADHRRTPGGLHPRGESQDRGWERLQDIPYRLATTCPECKSAPLDPHGACFLPVCLFVTGLTRVTNYVGIFAQSFPY